LPVEESNRMKKIYILLLVPFILYIALLGVMPLMEPDEARYSLIPSAMNETGNYVTPHIKHTIYLEKPPLASWATAISPDFDSKKNNIQLK
jgi:4-amino-4-deoxy-L-arabinose transferase-like glycosyltransferase